MRRMNEQQRRVVHARDKPTCLQHYNLTIMSHLVVCGIERKKEHISRKSGRVCWLAERRKNMETALDDEPRDGNWHAPTTSFIRLRMGR